MAKKKKKPVQLGLVTPKQLFEQMAKQYGIAMTWEENLAAKALAQAQVDFFHLRGLNMQNNFEDHTKAVTAETTRKIDALQEELRRIKSAYDKLCITHQNSFNENLKLREAGNLMAKCIRDFRSGKYCNAIDNVGGFKAYSKWLNATCSF